MYILQCFKMRNHYQLSASQFFTLTYILMQNAHRKGITNFQSRYFNYFLNASSVAHIVCNKTLFFCE